MKEKETAELEEILARTKEKEHPLITIDGPCASGKTTLARKLAEQINALVIHTDDYVVPHALKTAERLASPGGNCDAERLLSEIIIPWKQGSAGTYRRYDCRADRFCDEETLPTSGMLILEGSYSNLPEIRKYADVRIFVEVPWEERIRRLRERESDASLKRFFELWIPLEDAYFKAFSLPDEGCLRWQGMEKFF